MHAQLLNGQHLVFPPLSALVIPAALPERGMAETNLSGSSDKSQNDPEHQVGWFASYSVQVASRLLRQPVINHCEHISTYWSRG